jgi:hypothetical protein
MDAGSKPAAPMTGRELDETLGYLERVCATPLPDSVARWSREDSTNALIAASQVPQLIATIRALVHERALLIKERDEARALVKKLQEQSPLVIEDDRRQIALLTAVHDAVRIASDLGEKATDVAQMFAALSVARLATNLQAFLILLKSGFYVDAYGVARFASELGINLVWVNLGIPGGELKDPVERALALEQDSAAWMDKWWKGMNRHERQIPFPEDLVRKFEEATRDARHPTGLPNIEQRAKAAPITTEMYDFAYRGESAAPHAHARALVANWIGEPPIAKRLMLHNVVVAAMVVFGAAANLCDSSDAKEAADRLQRTIKEIVGAEAKDASASKESPG